MTIACVSTVPRTVGLFDLQMGQDLQPLLGVKMFSSLSTAHLFVLAAAAALVELAIVAEAALERFNARLAEVVETNVQGVADANPGGHDAAVTLALAAASAKPRQR
uniref:Uncharacterized protein n=1 Tax=Neobodo designis TaxID=312471 RepID=A0A7S1MIA7_NEODS